MKALPTVFIWLMFCGLAQAGNVITAFHVAGGTSVGTTTTPVGARSIDNTTWTYAYKVNGTPGANGTLSELCIYVQSASGADQFKLSLYAHDAGNNMPGAVIANATSVEDTMTASMVLHCIAIDSATPASIVSGTQYWVALEQLAGYNSVGSSGYVGAGAWDTSIKVQAGSYSWPDYAGTEDAGDTDYEVTAYFKYLP